MKALAVAVALYFFIDALQSLDYGQKTLLFFIVLVEFFVDAAFNIKLLNIDKQIKIGAIIGAWIALY